MQAVSREGKLPKKRGTLGLGSIPPVARLVVVIALTSSFSWIATLPTATVAFVASILTLLTSARRKAPPLILVLFTLGLYFGFSALLPTVSSITHHVAIKGVLLTYLRAAGVSGLKRGAMIALSLAWLASTPIPQIYTSLLWIRPSRRWISLFLRDIQIMRQRVGVMRSSLILRHKRCRWYEVKEHIGQFLLLLQGLIIFAFDHITTMTYVAETHLPHSPLPSSGLSLRHVYSRYSSGSEMSLYDISLEVSCGEFIYLGGKSQSGRTTLMRCISGVIPNLMGERSGTIMIGTTDIRDFELREISKYVKYVPPDPAESILGLTVAQEILSVSRDEQHARRCLEKMGIEHLWERETTTLSGGEQVRLVLAAVIASEIPVLLLDSPLEQLDVLGRADFLFAISAFQRCSESIVIVSDVSYEDLEPYITRIVLLESGAISANYSIRDADDDVLISAGIERRIGQSETVVQKDAERSAPLATLQGVRAEMNGCEVLHGIDLEIHSSECVAILGPNGGGKSTALLCLAGVVPNSGGSRMTSVRVGYVFQNAALQLLEITSRKEMALGPRFLKWDAEATQAFLKRGLEWCGLNGKEWCIDLHPRQVRLLGIASVNIDCGILVLDEPSIGLDLEDIEKVKRLIRELTSYGLGVFIITHDRYLAEAANRAVLIVGGTVTAHGSPRELFNTLVAFAEAGKMANENINKQ